METADALTEFTNWWIDTRPLVVPFDTPLMFDKPDVRGNANGVVLYRQEPWQVQLFILPPNSVTPSHRHPNVDSYEVYLAGDIEFSLDGKVLTPFTNEPDFVGGHKYFGRKVRVQPTSWHGAKCGAKGGAFLSIQKWLNGSHPTNVGDDWIAES